MAWYIAIYTGLVHAALASLLLLTLASAAVLFVRQPARRIRIIELTGAGLLVLPLLSLVPGVPRWSILPAIAGPQAAPIREAEPVFVVEAAPVPETIVAVDEPLGPFAPETIPQEPMSADDSIGSQIEEPLAVEAHSEHLSEPQPEPAPLPARTSPTVSAVPAARWPELPIDFRFWIVAAYLTGVAAMILWSFVGLLAVRRLLRSARPAEDACRALLREIAGPRSDRVALLVSPRVGQPCALAWRPTTIVLPEKMALGEDPQTLRWALAHEWSHVERWDIWSWTASGVVRWFYFYQPLLGWLRRQLQLCQDFVADARAARLGAVPEDYAEFLTVASSSFSHPPLAAGLGIGGRTSDLHRRVVMLVENHRPLESASPRKWNLVVLPIAALVVALLACVRGDQPASAAAEPETPAAAQAESPQPADAEATTEEDAAVTEKAAAVAEAPKQPESKPSEPPRIAPFDVLNFQCTIVSDAPWPPGIKGDHVVEPDGNVALGPRHGRINLQGKTIAEAEQAVIERLSKTIITRLSFTIKERPSFTIKAPKVQLTRKGKAVWRNRRMAPGELHVEVGDNLEVCFMHASQNNTNAGSGGGIATFGDAFLGSEQQFTVEPEGTIAMGPSFGRVRLQGLTLQAAEDTLREHLKPFVKGPEVSITLAGYSTFKMQPEPDNVPVVVGPVPAPPERDLIRPLDTIEITATKDVDPKVAGVYLVEPDGDIRLPESYGRVQVKGLDYSEASKAIRHRIQKKLALPWIPVTKRGRAIFPPGKAPGEGTAADGAYRIRMGDRLAICQSQQEIDQALDYEVQPDGLLATRFGEVAVTGLTLAEADKAIHEQREAHFRAGLHLGPEVGDEQKKQWAEKHANNPSIHFTPDYVTLGGWKEEKIEGLKGMGGGIF